jgi:hypothetical protein
LKNFHEFVMALLRWKKGSSIHHHALLVGKGQAFLACARADATRKSRTAVVNVIQAAIDAGVDPRSAWIYTTGSVDWACVGMARLQTRGGYIFYAGAGGALNCYLAAREGFGPVEEDEWPAPWSRKPEHWQALAPGARTLATWASALKNKTLFKPNWVPVKELQTKCSAAVTAVEGLAVGTGRGATTLAKFFDPSATGAFDIVSALKSQPEKDEFFSLLAQELVFRLSGRVETKVDADQIGHNIGSLMVDSANRVVGWAVNTNHQNGTYHGETNLVQAHEAHGNAALPKGGTMYTSLEPCEMCSGVIRTSVQAGDANFRVLYIQADKTLKGTALTRDDSPVKMKPSPAASVGGTLVTGAVFGDALAERQKALAARDKGFLAPTRFLRHDDALQVFKLAGEQRASTSGTHATNMANAFVRPEGVALAAHEQRAGRAAIQHGLSTPRRPDDIRRYTGGYARDDLDLLPVRRVMLERPAPRAYDDSSIGIKVRPVDPVLLKLAQDLDKLSVRFRRVFDAWMDTDGAVKAAPEKARLLKQVTDFLDKAEAACKTRA